MALPLADDSDFFGNHRKPPGVDPQHLRVIKDTALRSRLIMAGMAEGLQSPKGPQKIASIIRLYPDLRAPSPNRTRAVRRAPVEPSRIAHGLPTVEELNTLLHRISVVERDVSAQLQGQINAEISRLKSQIATLEGDEFERAFRQLDGALRARREVAKEVRAETFKRIDGDTAFDARKYLRLISREPRGLD
jgi:hypothetical protein